MRNLVVMMLSFAVLGAAGCSDDGGGASCKELCAKVNECEPDEDLTECEAMCTEMKQVMRESVFSDVSSCTLDSSCAELEEIDCLEEALENVSTASGERVLGAICDKMVECIPGGDLTKETCVSISREQPDDFLAVMGLFKSSVIDCLVSCYGKLACEDMDNADRCMQQCGLGFFETADDIDDEIEP